MPDLTSGSSREPPVPTRNRSGQSLCQCRNLIAQAALRFSITASRSSVLPLSGNRFDQILQGIPVAFPRLFSVHLEEFLQAFQQEHLVRREP